MHDDYSWYASSELAALSTTPGGYRTFQMPLEGRSQSNSVHDRAAGGKGPRGRKSVGRVRSAASTTPSQDAAPLQPSPRTATATSVATF